MSSTSYHCQSTENRSGHSKQDDIGESYSVPNESNRDLRLNHRRESRKFHQERYDLYEAARKRSDSPPEDTESSYGETRRSSLRRNRSESTPDLGRTARALRTDNQFKTLAQPEKIASSPIRHNIDSYMASSNRAGIKSLPSPDAAYAESSGDYLNMGLARAKVRLNSNVQIGHDTGFVSTLQPAPSESLCGSPPLVTPSSKSKSTHKETWSPHGSQHLPGNGARAEEKVNIDRVEEQPPRNQNTDSEEELSVEVAGIIKPEIDASTRPKLQQLGSSSKVNPNTVVAYESSLERGWAMPNQPSQSGKILTRGPPPVPEWSVSRSQTQPLNPFTKGMQYQPGNGGRSFSGQSSSLAPYTLGFQRGAYSYDMPYQQQVYYPALLPQHYNIGAQKPQESYLYDSGSQYEIPPNHLAPAWVQVPSQESKSPVDPLQRGTRVSQTQGSRRKKHRHTRSKSSSAKFKSLSRVLDVGSALDTQEDPEVETKTNSEDVDSISEESYWGVLPSPDSKDWVPIPIQLCEPPLSDSMPANTEALKPDPEPRTRKRSKYTREQDEVILEMKARGANWSEIAEHAQCDNSLAARNRYQVLIGQQGGGTHTWSREECRALQTLLDEGERAKWLYIAAELTKKQKKEFTIEACHYKISQLFADNPESFGVVRTRDKIGGGAPMKRRPLRPEPNQESEDDNEDLG